MFDARAIVKRPQLDGLRREVWSFVLLDGVVKFDRWEIQERKTARHKWRTTGDVWSRLKLDNSKTPRPTPPEDVILEAVDAIRQKIRFGG